MGKKFDQLFESVVQRYQAGGFLNGDLVKFKSNYKSSETYKFMHPEMQSQLDDLVKSGLNIKVTQVGDNLSGASANNQHKKPQNAVITVAGDHGGGRFYGQIAVSPDMIEIVDKDENAYPPIPDQFRRKSPGFDKGEKYKRDPKFITNVTDKGNGKNTPTQLKLAGEAKGYIGELGVIYENLGNDE